MRNGFHGALVASGLALMVIAAGCSHSPKPMSGMSGGMSAGASTGEHGEHGGHIVPLEAKITPTQGNTCQGTVRFEAEHGGAVKVTADLTGLEPNTQHGIHVHETGDCSAPDAMSAGAHYNPTQQPHGLPPADTRHAGDLGNLTSDADGHAHYTITVTNLSLSSTGNSILGRAVIVHAKPDDGGQPSGNSGARVGCGVIAAAAK
jgi:Cu-Zn family superoxide dismutase